MTTHTNRSNSVFKYHHSFVPLLLLLGQQLDAVSGTWRGSKWGVQRERDYLDVSAPPKLNANVSLAEREKKSKCLSYVWACLVIMASFLLSQFCPSLASCSLQIHRAEVTLGLQSEYVIHFVLLGPA